MIAKVHWFDKRIGYGFVITQDGKEFFVHQSSINMSGFRYLQEDDIVNFEVGTGNNGREQAVDVIPILTRKMISDVLKKEKLHVKEMKDANNVTKYLVVDENNVIQTDEYGMSFMELAEFTGYSIVEE